MKDLSRSIKSFNIEERTSSKTGKKYSVLVATFNNGYTLETFLNQEQLFILNSIH